MNLLKAKNSIGRDHQKTPAAKGVIRVGTSGIVLPGTKTTFPKEYQSSSRLHYYGSLFNTLEINSSFYKMPMPKTYEKWASEVPHDFEFTVKLWREITHSNKLEYCEENIDLFMEGANRLGHKRGCLLVQFPASVTVDLISNVEKIVNRLAFLNHIEADKGEKKWRVAVEVRHNSWYCIETYKMFEKFDASLVVHDMPKSRTPLNVHCEFDSLLKDFVYLRFHGPTGDYNGSYSNEILESYVSFIKDWNLQGRDVYIYFNNTIGDALGNLKTLQDFMSASCID